VKAEPVNISLSWGTLEGLHWPRPGAPRVLCLHGWLDNAASFVPLAPWLEAFDLLALDLAGHGLSSHRPQSSHYYFTEYLFDLDEALDVLGWERCHLVGHSLGGGIGSCYAAAAAERVERLVLLDSLGLISLPPERAAQQLQLSMASVRKARSFLRPYESVEEAMLARQKKSPLSDAAARLLCERSLAHTGDFYQWRTDPRLNWRSPQYPGDDQVLNLLSAIRAPTLVLTTPAAAAHFGDDMTRRRLAAIPDCTHISFEGHHHFHMEDPQRVGLRISEFLLQDDQSQEPHHADSQ
jgi:pimeloyl-ACP methyl ester carboxylesterase